MNDSEGQGRQWSMRTLLLAVAAIVLVVTAVVNGMFTLRSYRDARQRAARSVGATVRLAAGALSSDLDGAAKEAATSAPGLAPVFTAGVDLSDPQVCVLTFGRRGLFTAGEQHLLDTSGAVACSSEANGRGMSYAAAPWFGELEAKSPVAAYEDRDPVTGQPSVVVGAAVKDPGGRTVGHSLTVLRAAAVPETLARVYGALAGARFLLVGPTGNLIPGAGLPAGPPPRVGDGEVGEGPDGVRRIWGTGRIPAAGWRLLGGVPEAEALAPARSELRRAVAVAGVSLLAYVLLVLAVNRILVRPVRELSRTVVRARTDRGARAPERGPAELAHLAGELNDMLAARERDEDRLAELAAELRAAATHLVEAREQDRQTLAMSLHDEAIQGMVAAMWGLDAIATESPVADSLAAVRANLDATITATRTLLSDLRPAALAEAGLSEAVAALALRFELEGGFAVEVDDRLEGARFPEPVEVLGYRTVQESLVNVRKHARASRAGVTLEERDGLLRVTVVDDGVGVDETVMTRSEDFGHYGVVSMRDTVRLAGGSFRIGRAPGGGTEVHAEFPVDRERASLEPAGP